METRYIIGRRMLVGKRMREIGEAYPEAATLPNLEQLLLLGDVRIDRDEQYIALKPMKIGATIRKIGELVPEAKRWPNLATLLRLGDLRVATDTEVELRSKKKAG